MLHYVLLHYSSKWYTRAKKKADQYVSSIAGVKEEFIFNVRDEKF